jgi:hypothetical protein
MSLDISAYLGEADAQPQAGKWTLPWNLPIEHWSASSLAMLHRCPYQWQQRYIRGIKERPGEAPVLGSAVHKAIEKNFGQKIESHEDLPIVPLLDYYAEEAFPEIVKSEQEKTGLEIVWDSDENPDKAREKARQRGKVMLAEYHGGVAPRVQPSRVESIISVDFGVPVPVEGRFDVERPAGTIDVKTGKSKTSKPKEAWRIQAAVYGKATEKPVEFHHISATVKTGAVNVVTPLESEAMLVHPTRRERAEIERSIRILSALAVFYMQMYGPDNDWPTLGRLHTWACDYCGFRAGCPAWQEA